MNIFNTAHRVQWKLRWIIELYNPEGNALPWKKNQWHQMNGHNLYSHGKNNIDFKKEIST